jgi:hypothetical protein
MRPFAAIVALGGDLAVLLALAHLLVLSETPEMSLFSSGFALGLCF